MTHRFSIFLQVGHRSALVYTLLLSLAFFGCKQKPEVKETPIPDRWYRNSIIYNLDVDSYQDSDGDGIGDFTGLISRLPYLKSIGVKVIWLSPFQPTPDRDDGYDVSDYYGIDKRLGSMEDFQRFMKAAKAHDIKIVMDMVLNHTSIDHPWFQAARADSSGKLRSRYVWSETQPKDYDKGMAFEGVQTETWSYDEIAKRYYFHRFYDFQPDLNYRNKAVQLEAIKILQYWTKKGILGFRLDAVPFIIDVPENGADKPSHLYGVLDSLVRGAKQVNPEVLLLGEANVETRENVEYFGTKGERLSMMFNFYANQFLFYSLAKEEPSSFVKALEDTRSKPGASQWAFFLRNHDEIDLGRLSKRQRETVYDDMGPEPNMQLYNRGIRRRLAPMLNNNAKLKMAYSLLYSLPGTPVIRSGEEIGMGDDLTLRERLSVRTPMQWDTTANAGFTTAKKAFRQVISLGDYSYKKINVQLEEKDDGSLLNHIKKVIGLRKKCPEIGTSTWTSIATEDKHVMGLEYQPKSGHLIVLHNFSAEPAQVNLALSAKATDLYNNKSLPSGKQTIQLPAYGAAWIREE